MDDPFVGSSTTVARNDGSRDLFQAFHGPLQRIARLQRQGPNALDGIDLLDEESGLPAEWMRMLQERIQAGPSPGEDADETDSEQYALELNTWLLVQLLYVQRSQPAPSSSRTSFSPYTTPLTLVQESIQTDPALSELSIVRDWLSSTASIHPAEVRKGYLPYTKNKLKHALRTGSKPPNNLVESLDPDATNRVSDGKRKVLDSEDANYEKALMRSLWEYVRVGALDEAIDMCRQSDCAWRAASLSGGKLYSDSVLDGLGKSKDGMDMMLAETESRKPQGNLRRRLWKSTCRAIAGSEHLDIYERALYAAIAGESESVIPVCQTWEDHLWAHVNSLLEKRIDRLLQDHASKNYLLSTFDTLDNDDGRAFQDVSQPIARTMQDIFDSLLAHPKLRLQARSPYHVAQTWIIQNKMADLLTTFAGKLEESAETLDTPQIAHLLRFFSHLVLFLRLLDQRSAVEFPQLPQDACSAILEFYIRTLHILGEPVSLVAFYCGALEAGAAIEAYSQYLYTEYPSSPSPTDGRPASERAERRTALHLARDNGLDSANIARRVTQLTLSGVLDELPDFDAAKAAFGLQSSSNPAGVVQTTRETELIRSIEWLTIDIETFFDALQQANALMRYFLCAGSPHLARKITYQVPQELLAVVAQTMSPPPEAQIDEYEDFVAFFDILQLHDQFTEAWSRRHEYTMRKTTQIEFANGLSNLTRRLFDAVVELLTSEWLCQDEIEGDERRQAELRRIRAAYVPELVFRLHSALLDTGRELIPSNLQLALELSTIVADERFRIYVEFMGDGFSGSAEQNRLKEYLELVRQASLAMLQKNNDPFSVAADGGDK